MIDSTQINVEHVKVAELSVPASHFEGYICIWMAREALKKRNGTWNNSYRDNMPIDSSQTNASTTIDAGTS